jgi:hypothetical protein
MWVDSDVTRIIGPALAKELSTQELRVLNFVAEYGKINVSECYRLLDIRTWHTAKKLLLRIEFATLIWPTLIF